MKMIIKHGMRTKMRHRAAPGGIAAGSISESRTRERLRHAHNNLGASQSTIAWPANLTLTAHPALWITSRQTRIAAETTTRKHDCGLAKRRNLMHEWERAINPE